MEVTVLISPETAILAGSSKSGTFPLPITDEFIAELNEIEREMLIVLVKHSTDLSLYNKNGQSVAHKPIARADLPSLKAYIKHCIAVRDAANEKLNADETRIKAEQDRADEKRIREWMAKAPSEKLSTYRPVSVMLPTVYDAPSGVSVEYNAHIAELRELADKREAELKREAAEREAIERCETAEQKDNVCHWIAEHGSASMQARALEGLLPEKELLNAVRDWLFPPFDGFDRYVRLDDGDARHADDCYTGAPIGYKTEDADELTAAEFERLSALREVAKTLTAPADVQAREHRVWCKQKECPGMTMRRSARVSIFWNGFELTREYALTLPGGDSFDGDDD